MTENQKNEASFTYSYSAREQEEVRKIREKYCTSTESDEDKMQKLRSLDASVYHKAAAFSLSVGVLSILVMGLGMCCCLVWEAYVPGIAVGLLGIIGVILAYPVYSSTTKKEREKIAPEIIRLTDELMK